MTRRGKAIFLAFWTATLTLLATAIAMAVWVAPIDAERGLIQHIMYLHLATAINMLIGCAIVFAANCAYFWRRDPKWDALGDAGARVVVLLGFIVLCTGMLWAKRVWGHWWEWSPPLTFSLALWLLYVGYVINRALQHTPELRAWRSAAFGIFAFLDVPLVYLSIRLLPGSHLAPVERAPAAANTMLVWLAAVLFLTVALILTRATLTRVQQARQTHAATGPEPIPAPAAAKPRRIIA
ncbi:MAG: cytochrome c biogenesis protein CcsA [Phycisphaeraceae bacterium]|nr:cytochrome c biogenesis protein CcsA [Phycisphaeraceae bacterium]MCB9848639.1 cytochrome c biogenesis protein CcsA [Phycisphaeraceae bacterium]